MIAPVPQKIDSAQGPTSVSVLMATCAQDSSAWIEAALESLAQQTRPADEVVLVEDGPSPPHISEILDRYVERLRMRRVQLPQRKGLGSALSVGLAECRSGLVARMDSDDICEPQRLELQLAEFEREPDLSVLGSTATTIDEAGNRVGVLGVPASPEEIRRRIWACPLLHPTVTFRRSDVMKIGGYDPRLRVRQDYDLWFRCVGAGLKMRNLQQPLVRYRLSRIPKNRRFSVVVRQTIVGWRGCRRIKAPLYAWLAVGTPLVLYFLPPPVPSILRQRFKFGDQGWI